MQHLIHPLRSWFDQRQNSINTTRAIESTLNSRCMPKYTLYYIILHKTFERNSTQPKHVFHRPPKIFNTHDFMKLAHFSFFSSVFVGVK